MSYSGSATDRLAAVREAIGATLLSQEYYVGARRQRRANLKDLRAMEVELIAEVQSEGSGTSMAELTVLVGADQ